MSIIKKPYEISLWEDVLTFVYDDGYESEEKVADNHGAVKIQYYKERKICVIGSDTMNTPLRASQPKLISKINGENILTFNMYSHYYDEENSMYFNNPFINLLINERKIKLRYGAPDDANVKWYDFVIKNIQENSETKTYTYTAKDLFVNELSKSGFNLEFDPELENNMGNIETLAEIILEESDWKLKPSGEILKQTIEEPLYLAQLNQEIEAKDLEDESNKIIVPIGSYIYLFYNNIVNKQSFIQFLYVSDGKYQKDEDNIIINSPNWCIENIDYSPSGIPNFTNEISISSEYRGRRLVRKTQTLYDSHIDKYVNVYESEGKKIYGFTETEYNSPASVRSYITNSNSYSSYTGWEIGGVQNSGQVVFPSLELVTVPDIRDIDLSNTQIDNINFTSCLKFTNTNTNQVLFNSGITDHRHYINGFVQGEKYVFRVKYGEADIKGTYGAKTLKHPSVDLTLEIKEYELKDGIYLDKGETPYFSCVINSEANGMAPLYQMVEVECQRSLSYAEMVEMTNSLGLFIKVNSAATIYIEDVQFFKYVDNNGQILLPNEFSNGNVKTIYYYYYPSDLYKTIEDVNFIYKGEQPAPYAEVYNGTGYEKIRSISASESNRFNLIQELCEIFECWSNFEIEHNLKTGEILLDEDYRQRKWVSFHEYIDKRNYTGFKYGINLKSIQRTLESEAIVSKLIVKNNDNEFGTDGFCSIARASENQSGENFILDFSYYIQQGLLGASEVTNDLYSQFNGFIGYYSNLKKINESRDLYIKEQSGLLTDIAEYSASLQTYSLSAAEADKQYRDKLILIKTLTGLSFEQLIADKENDWWNNDQVVITMASIGRLKSTADNHRKLAEQTQKNLDEAQNRFDLIERILTSREVSEQEPRLLLQKEKLHLAFYKKYSRFLQEGSWISENYIDDTLYYLDAQSTLHTSSQPKVTYNISVLELSQLDGYENFVFSLGDITTIEDTEFFGWTWTENGLKTPYKEEIIVTETTNMLDSPEQNQIKVQNYKSNFEDLFQRMAATTQAVEYSTGKYQKVAGIVEDDGTINITTLQHSIANNALILQNSKDQTVIWDETGITTTSPTDPTRIVRIVNGGIFLSRDGGIEWRTGITGDGINADYVTTGNLNVDQVNILHGGMSSFRWDSKGINAYEFNINKETGEISGFNNSKFVRFDQYGLYGVDGFANFDPLIEENGISGEDKIWKHSNFALTWKGFQIKSKHSEGGYISITSTDDFQVINSQGKSQVKIGLLYVENDEPIYGLQIKDKNEKIVIEHGSDGKVWIKDELKIGNYSSSVALGILEGNKATKYDGTVKNNYDNVAPENIHEVINANNKFLVYEDGSMKATDGEFTGVIHATGGTIGGLQIDSIVNPDFEVRIESSNGTVFKDSTQKTLTAILYKGSQPIVENVGYQWYKYTEVIEGATSNSITVQLEDLDGESGQATYRCEIVYPKEEQ